MSVRHQVRSKVERLFENLKERADSGEFTLYCVYSPVYVQRENLPASQISVEEFEFVDLKVNMGDTESVKKTLDRITREALENEVKGFYFLGMLLEKEGDYIISSENPIMEELKDSLIETIERLREE
ncbi:MAG: hypothetical protein N3D14_04400 [Aquificaceae bacterium]|nr:hypothetical protein [Aquificaceae bacterium]